MSCAICFESFNKTKRSRVICPYCPTDETEVPCCRGCVQTYLLQDDAQSPRCPSCRAGWTEDFLSDTFPKTWLLKEYKIRREQVLLDMERARLPEAQEDAGRYKRARELMQQVDAQTTPIQQQIDSLIEHVEEERTRQIYFAKQSNRYRIERLKGWERDDAAREEESKAWADHSKAKELLDVQRIPLQIQINRIRAEAKYNAAKLCVSRFGQERTTQEPREASAWTFVMKCAEPDCQGFVGMNWKCGLCEVKFCKDCTEKEGEGHECNPDTKATAQAMRKEAKPCPKCAAMISKIDGCDQMWCTQCQTAFSWRSGQIEASHIHNPHYFQWMRTNGTPAPVRNNGECLEPHEILTQAIYYLRHNTTMIGWCRMIRHFEFVSRSMRRDLQHKQGDEWRRQLRVQRLVNELTDDQWKVKLQKGEKAAQKLHRILQVLDMFHQVSTDLLREALLDTSDKEQIHQQLLQVQQYCNEAFGKIQKRFNMEVPVIEFRS